MRKYSITLLVTIALLSTSLRSQKPYYFKHYKVEHGLSNNTVLCSQQDRDGFMWFGTIDGLNRFDGYAFKTFRHDQSNQKSLGNNSVFALEAVADGSMWVGTSGGLFKFDPLNENFTLIPGTEKQNVRSIKLDAKGNVWMILQANLVLYTEKTGQLKSFGSKVKNVSSICFTQDQLLWVATSDGLLKKYNPVTDSFQDTHTAQAGSPDRIEEIYDTKKGSLLIGTFQEGLKLYDIKTRTFKDIIVYNHDRTEIFIRAVEQYSENEFWVATEYGIFIYNLKTNGFVQLLRNYDNPYSISDNAVNTLCKDREGGIWIGTRFGGINYYAYPYVSFQKYFAQTGNNSISGNGVHEICPDNAGNLWIGTEDAGLNRLDLKTGLFKHFTPDGKKGSISYSNIHGLLVDGDNLWIGTYQRGLDKMNLKNGKVFKHYSAGKNSLSSNFIVHLFKTSSGDIYAGTWTGLYRYNKKRDDFDALPKFNFQTQSIIEDKNGVLWICTLGNGVYTYHPHTGHIQNLRHDPKNANSLSNNMVNGMFKDSRGIWWFATEGGLCKYDPVKRRFTSYSTKNGLPSNFIFKILEDKNNNLWVSSTKGLIRFNPQSESIKVFTTANGLLNDQFNWNSAYKDSSGRMYFGSVNGMISFRPEDFSTNRFTPPVYITGFQVHEKELPVGKGSPLEQSVIYTKDVTLKYNQSTISIDFAALSFTTPLMNEYAYKMDGIDKGWTYLKTNRKAYFTDLAPGSYQFKVKASNGSGVWNKAETRLNIEILPPIWASKLAYAFYTFLFLLMAYLAISNYHNRVAEKNKRKIELLEHEKEKELYQAKIDFFTNVAHEIRTPLTLIKAPMEKMMLKSEEVPEIKNNLRIMERNTERLVELTNQLLDFRKTEANGFSLSFLNVDITELLKEFHQNFKFLAEEKELEYIISTPFHAIHAYIDTDAFNKILSNLYTNAIKYADRKVEVSLHTIEEGTKFQIEIKNDGYLIQDAEREKIFEPFYRIKETEMQKGTGIGLALARSLTELHKGTIELKKVAEPMNVFVATFPVHQDSEINFFHIVKAVENSEAAI